MHVHFSWQSQQRDSRNETRKSKKYLKVHFLTFHTVNKPCNQRKGNRKNAPKVIKKLHKSSKKSSSSWNVNHPSLTSFVHPWGTLTQHSPTSPWRSQSKARWGCTGRAWQWRRSSLEVRIVVDVSRHLRYYPSSRSNGNFSLFRSPLSPREKKTQFTRDRRKLKNETENHSRTFLFSFFFWIYKSTSRALNFSRSDLGDLVGATEITRAHSRDFPEKKKIIQNYSISSVNLEERERKVMTIWASVIKWFYYSLSFSSSRRWERELRCGTSQSHHSCEDTRLLFSF